MNNNTDFAGGECYDVIVSLNYISLKKEFRPSRRLSLVSNSSCVRERSICLPLCHPSCLAGRRTTVFHIDNSRRPQSIDVNQGPLIVDTHYTKLMEMSPAVNRTTTLRDTLDVIEQHLRSLQSLGEDVNQRQIISVIRTKLPKVVISRLEQQK